MLEGLAMWLLSSWKLLNIRISIAAREVERSILSETLVSFVLRAGPKHASYKIVGAACVVGIIVDKNSIRDVLDVDLKVLTEFCCTISTKGTDRLVGPVPGHCMLINYLGLAYKKGVIYLPNEMSRVPKQGH